MTGAAENNRVQRRRSGPFHEPGLYNLGPLDELLYAIDTNNTNQAHQLAATVWAETVRLATRLHASHLASWANTALSCEDCKRTITNEPYTATIVYTNDKPTTAIQCEHCTILLDHLNNAITDNHELDPDPDEWPTPSALDQALDVYGELIDPRLGAAYQTKWLKPENPQQHFGFGDDTDNHGRYRPETITRWTNQPTEQGETHS